MDNSFTWFAHVHGQGSLAFTAHDCGYDIWVGTLRGCEGSIQHVNKNITPKEYWNFTVNEHAFFDFPAFIHKIVEVKNKEFSERRIKSLNTNTSSRDGEHNSQTENLLGGNAQTTTTTTTTTTTNNDHKQMLCNLPFDITVVAHSVCSHSLPLLNIIDCSSLILF
jgi:hypothetical protein